MASGKVDGPHVCPGRERPPRKLRAAPQAQHLSLATAVASPCRGQGGKGKGGGKSLKSDVKGDSSPTSRGAKSASVGCSDGTSPLERRKRSRQGQRRVQGPGWQAGLLGALRRKGESYPGGAGSLARHRAQSSVGSLDKNGDGSAWDLGKGASDKPEHAFFLQAQTLPDLLEP